MMSPDDLKQAGQRLSLLDLDAIQQQQLTAEVLRAALDHVTANGPLDVGELLGCEFNERSLRFGLERSYRAQAQLASDRGRRIDLVDQANDVRPRTWS
jgi:serine/threonine-protein kinase PknG